MGTAHELRTAVEAEPQTRQGREAWSGTGARQCAGAADRTATSTTTTRVETGLTSQLFHPLSALACPYRIYVRKGRVRLLHVCRRRQQTKRCASLSLCVARCRQQAAPMSLARVARGRAGALLTPPLQAQCCTGRVVLTTTCKLTSSRHAGRLAEAARLRCQAIVWRGAAHGGVSAVCRSASGGEAAGEGQGSGGKRDRQACRTPASDRD